MTTRPVTVPTLQDRARCLEPLGWSGRKAEWIALVALHTGVFTRSQWCHFFDGANREAARVFVRQLIDKQLAIEDERAIFPGGRAPVPAPHVAAFAFGRRAGDRRRRGPSPGQSHREPGPRMADPSRSGASIPAWRFSAPSGPVKRRRVCTRSHASS